jgi:hypothetical protein
MTRQTRDLLIQITVVILLLAGSWAVMNAFGVFSPRGKGVNDVIFRVEGSPAAAVVTYTQEDGQATAPLDVSLPWQKKIRYTRSMAVILTAANPSQTGRIECSIILNGATWKEDVATSPLDKVSCAGILP